MCRIKSFSERMLVLILFFFFLVGASLSNPFEVSMLRREVSVNTLSLKLC